MSSGSNRECRADEEVTVLSEMVVTPSRQERPAVSVPFSVFEISAESVQLDQLYRTTPETIERFPSVMVQKTSYGQGSPYLRGFTGYRTLFLVDGIRLNNAVFRDGPNQYWNTVDPFSLREVELMLGPASVLYGSDAVGGTVNALTVNPPVYNGAFEAEGRGYYRVSSAEQSNIGRFQAGLAANEYFSAVAGITLKDFGDLKGGRDVGEQPHTGYSEKDYDVKGVVTLSEAAALTIAHQTVNLDNAWRTHKTIYGITWEGLRHGDDLERSYDQHRHLTYAGLELTPASAFFEAADLKVSYQVQSEDEFRIKSSASQQKQGFNCDTLGVSLSMISPSTVGTLVYGGEYYRDAVGSYRNAYNSDGELTKVYLQGPVADDATYDTAAAFVEDTVSFLDDRMEAVAGGRYTYAAANADKVLDPATGKPMSISDSWNDLSGSARLLYYLTEQHDSSVFAGLSQAFRAPNLSDMTRYDSARSDEIETPVTHLDPEKFLTYEVGLKTRTAKHALQFALYYTDIRDMIIRTPTGRTIEGENEVTKKNSGDGYVCGAELAARYWFTPQWSAKLAGSWMEGKVDTYPTSTTQKEEDYISRLMPPTAHLALRWESGNGRCWIEASSDMAAKADKLSDRDKSDTQRIPPGGTPGYIVFNLNGGVKLNDIIALTAACENIADEDYRIHGSGVNEPGRNFELALNVTF
jgi:hemoglobin/transferrin/lactoferrin receptor protein